MLKIPKLSLEKKNRVFQFKVCKKGIFEHLDSSDDYRHKIYCHIVFLCIVFSMRELFIV